MTTKAKVAVLYTKPESVLEDYARLCELGGMNQALDSSATTILKDNITWHFPMPGANTTPLAIGRRHPGVERSRIPEHGLRTKPDRGDQCIQG